MPSRKPQINFQVQPGMKLLYDEVQASGQRATRLCAAGLLLLIEDSQVRTRAMRRLRAWEDTYANATPDEIRTLVESGRARIGRPT